MKKVINQKRFQALKARADKNWAERAEIIAEAREIVEGEINLRDVIKIFDKTFVRKLRRYPADITTVRVSKVMGKLADLHGDGPVKELMNKLARIF